MPSVNVSPFGPKPQFLLATGLPAVGYQLFWYVGGSVNTKQNTYSDSTGTVANANPLVMNSLGEPATELWLTAGQSYKAVLAPATDTDPPTSPIWTIDGLRGINDTSVSIDQWVAPGLTPTYVGATQFTLVGDQTSAFHVGRRVKATVSGGTSYGTITASVFGAVTTVTVDTTGSIALDSGLSAVSYGLLSAVDSSEPVLPDNIFRVSGSADRTKKVAFEVDGLTTATTRTLTVQDASGTIALLSQTVVRGYISGLSWANNAGDATNDIDIATGVATDSLNVYTMTLGTAITKQSDVLWAVGTNQGALDTGAVGNSDYYMWLIGDPTAGVVDVLFSLSSTAPNMTRPGGTYTAKRLIGWFKRTGGTIVAMTTYEAEGGGIELLWTVPTLDINLANTLTTARRTDAVKVPLNISTTAHLNVVITDAGTTFAVWIGCPDQTDAAPSLTAAPLSNIATTNSASVGALLRIRTSATGTVAARATIATIDLYAASTMGFTWARRN